MNDKPDPEDIATARQILAQLLADRAEELADEIIDSVLRLSGGEIPKSQEELWRLIKEAMHSLPDRSVS